jgi:isoaspartyl peptidase/L-asparaginase-like protein (Ntn-hydrolase superfamily)
MRQVVRRLEDSAYFNAGRGSVFTNFGTHEMDAAIMDGSCLRVVSVRCPCTVQAAIKRMLTRTRSDVGNQVQREVPER